MNIVDVLWVLSDRDDLVNQSRHGIYPFSACRSDSDRDAIYYDDTHPVRDEDGSVRYPVVLDYLVDDCHHDIISEYGTIAEDYTVTISAVKFESEDDFEIEMIVKADDSSTEGNDIVYCISNGQYSTC